MSTPHDFWYIWHGGGRFDLRTRATTIAGAVHPAATCHMCTGHSLTTRQCQQDIPDTSVTRSCAPSLPAQPVEGIARALLRCHRASAFSGGISSLQWRPAHGYFVLVYGSSHMIRISACPGACFACSVFVGYARSTWSALCRLELHTLSAQRRAPPPTLTTPRNRTTKGQTATRRHRHPRRLFDSRATRHLHLRLVLHGP